MFYFVYPILLFLFIIIIFIIGRDNFKAKAIYNDAKLDVTELKLAVGKLEKKLVDLEEEKSKLTNDLVVSRSVISDLVNDKNTRNHEISDCQNLYEKSVEDFDKLQSLLQKKIDDYQKLEKLCNERLASSESENLNFNQMIGIHDKRYERLNESNLELKKIISSLESENAKKIEETIETKNTEIRNQLSEYCRKYEVEISNHKQNILEIENEYEVLYSDINLLLKSSDSLLTELNREGDLLSQLELTSLPESDFKSAIVSKLGSVFFDIYTRIEELNYAFSNNLINTTKINLDLNREAEINAQNLNRISNLEKILESLRKNPNQGILSLSAIISDLEHLVFEVSIKNLNTKSQPAKVEALRIKELKERSRRYLLDYKVMLYKYEYVFKLFPELNDYVDDINQDNLNIDLEFANENYDRVKNYIEKEQFNTLSTIERNQLAFDNYSIRNKSKWQIGRDYELYCGYLYEKKGWNVEYFGIDRRLEDLGRDLIARKGNQVHVIQCKFWSERKMIHEKHIAQLYGTTIVYEIENESLFTTEVTPVFMTNTKLSSTAIKFAQRLKVEILKEKPKDFPQIKCSIRKNDNGKITKIYHLPFDQHYDRLKMSNENCTFVRTVREAEENGFRRSFKFKGISKDDVQSKSS